MQHGAEVARRGGATVETLRAAPAERASRDDVFGVEAVDDAQAVADAVLRVDALAVAGSQHPGHAALVQEGVALRDRGIGSEQRGHAGSIRVTKRALLPCATALTTGASTYSP